MSTTDTAFPAESFTPAFRFGLRRLQPLPVFGVACLAVLLFALVPATTRVATAELSGLSVGLVRAVGAGLFSFPLLLTLRLPRPRRKDLGLLLLYALGNFAGFPLLFAVGVRQTSGSHAALIMAIMPLLIGLIGMLLERRVPRSMWFIGAAIAVGGEATLVGFGGMSRSADASIAGDAVVLAACTLSALGIAAGARLGARITPLAATLWATAIAGASLAPWAAIRLLASPYAYQNLSVTTGAALVQITLGAAVIGNFLWLWAISRGGLVRIAPIQFVQPVGALFLACALLHEPVSTPLILLATSIVIGTVTACRGARARKAGKDIDCANVLPRLQGAPGLVPDAGNWIGQSDDMLRPNHRPVLPQPHRI